MATGTESATFNFDVLLTTDKHGRLGKVNRQKIYYFLEQAQDGTCMSYKDFLAPHFVANDFYVIINMLIANGLATKEGSKYRLAGGFKIKFRNFLNENLLSLCF